jgi:cobaltochelatase CobT
MSDPDKLARTLAHRSDMQVSYSPEGPALRDNTLLLPDGLSDAATVNGYVDMLVARRTHCDNDAINAASESARSIAQAFDDHRACRLLADAYPGAKAFMRAMRLHRQNSVLSRWNALKWRERLTWRIERMLWNEPLTQAENSPSLDSALEIAGDLLTQAHASTSTAESLRLAEQVVERVRALRAGGVNNMMFTAEHDDGDSFELEAEASEHGTPDPFADLSEADSQAPAPKPVLTRPQRSIPVTTAYDQVTDLTGQGDATAWRKLRAAARTQTEPLKARLERALKADEQTHWKREQERGELDRPSLARLATSPGYRTPFRSQRIRPGRDAAVTLLIDRSGSMAGRKIELARLCAAAIADALVQLGFAAEVLGYSSIEDERMRAFHERWLAQGNQPQGFNRFVERLDFEVYKRFDSENMSGLARIECGHENPDGEALSWAAERLLARRAQRHILMVLQDGYPATGDGNPAILRTDLRLRIDELLARGVELIGVGILDDAVEQFYPTSIVVEEIQQLPAAAFKVLGRTLLSRREWMLERA